VAGLLLSEGGRTGWGRRVKGEGRRGKRDRLRNVPDDGNPQNMLPKTYHSPPTTHTQPFFLFFPPLFFIPHFFLHPSYPPCFSSSRSPFNLIFPILFSFFASIFI
jgi:hypothetical protein